MHMHIYAHTHAHIHMHRHILGCNKVQKNKSIRLHLLPVLPSLAHWPLLTPETLRLFPRGMCEGVVSEKSIFLVNFLPVCQLIYHLMGILLGK